MPATATPPVHYATPNGSHVEIANAWGWLLNRAPRIARHLEEIPGAAKMFANVLAAVDLVIRMEYSGDAKAFGRKRDFDVSMNQDRSVIIISLARR